MKKSLVVVVFLLPSLFLDAQKIPESKICEVLNNFINVLSKKEKESINEQHFDALFFKCPDKTGGELCQCIENMYTRENSPTACQSPGFIYNLLNGNKNFTDLSISFVGKVYKYDEPTTLNLEDIQNDLINLKCFKKEMLGGNVENDYFYLKTSIAKQKFKTKITYDEKNGINRDDIVVIHWIYPKAEKNLKVADFKIIALHPATDYKKLLPAMPLSCKESTPIVGIDLEKGIKKGFENYMKEFSNLGKSDKVNNGFKNIFLDYNSVKIEDIYGFSDDAVTVVAPSVFERKGFEISFPAASPEIRYDQPKQFNVKALDKIFPDYEFLSSKYLSDYLQRNAGKKYFYIRSGIALQKFTSKNSSYPDSRQDSIMVHWICEQTGKGKYDKFKIISLERYGKDSFFETRLPWYELPKLKNREREKLNFGVKDFVDRLTNNMHLVIKGTMPMQELVENNFKTDRPVQVAMDVVTTEIGKPYNPIEYFTELKKVESLEKLVSNITLSTPISLDKTGKLLLMEVKAVTISKYEIAAGEIMVVEAPIRIDVEFSFDKNKKQVSDARIAGISLDGKAKHRQIFLEKERENAIIRLKSLYQEIDKLPGSNAAVKVKNSLLENFMVSKDSYLESCLSGNKTRMKAKGYFDEVVKNRGVRHVLSNSINDIAFELNIAKKEYHLNFTSVLTVDIERNGLIHTYSMPIKAKFVRNLQEKEDFKIEAVEIVGEISLTSTKPPPPTCDDQEALRKCRTDGGNMINSYVDLLSQYADSKSLSASDRSQLEGLFLNHEDVSIGVSSYKKEKRATPVNYKGVEAYLDHFNKYSYNSVHITDAIIELPNQMDSDDMNWFGEIRFLQLFDGMGLKSYYCDMTEKKVRVWVNKQDCKIALGDIQADADITVKTPCGIASSLPGITYKIQIASLGKANLSDNWFDNAKAFGSMSIEEYVQVKTKHKRVMVSLDTPDFPTVGMTLMDLRKHYPGAYIVCYSDGQRIEGKCYYPLENFGTD